MHPKRAVIRSIIYDNSSLKVLVIDTRARDILWEVEISRRADNELLNSSNGIHKLHL